ncbi:MAG: ABC transporter ATP-binding protein [Elusimicrobia bacterium]|nr:ABC transporter ATP-binding protein [Elusimicrobiota bacterium]
MIDCRDLVRIYGAEKKGYQALRGVSFAIARGEFAAVMGPSGCGKSTLLNILGLLDRPTMGKFLLQGKDTSHLGDGERTALRRQTIGFVFQAFNLLPRLSALENVSLPMTYAGAHRPEREARARELLEKVGLASKARHTPLELSGGERQRVGIARSLANRPSILLADEPTGNLDSQSSAEILAMLKELNSGGMTIVLVTHDPNIAKGAGRVLRLRDGKLES